MHDISMILIKYVNFDQIGKNEFDSEWFIKTHISRLMSFIKQNYCIVIKVSRSHCYRRTLYISLKVDNSSYVLFNKRTLDFFCFFEQLNLKKTMNVFFCLYFDEVLLNLFFLSVSVVSSLIISTQRRNLMQQKTIRCKHIKHIMAL